MSQTDDRTTDGLWTVHRTSLLSIPDEMRIAPAAVGVEKALQAQRQAAEQLQIPAELFDSIDADVPKFNQTLNRALQQAAADTRSVVRATALRASLDSRFDEFRKSINVHWPKTDDFLAECDSWIANCGERCGPYGTLSSYNALLSRAHAMAGKVGSLTPSLDSQSADAERLLTESILKADEAIAAFESSIFVPEVQQGILNRKSLTRASSYLLWTFVSILVVLLLLPGRSWTFQIVAMVACFTPLGALQRLLNRNDSMENVQSSKVSLTREAQASIRRLSPQIRAYFALAERRFVALKHKEFNAEVARKLEERGTEYNRLGAALHGLERAAADRVRKIPDGPFVEITPTRWQLIGRQPAEAILQSRVPDIATGEFSRRILKKYEVMHQTSLAQDIVSNDSRIKRNLEKVLVDEVGLVTSNDVIDAVINVDGGETFRLHMKILAGAARNVYRFGSMLCRDQHTGCFTLAIPETCGPQIRTCIEQAFTKRPTPQVSMGNDIEISWSALNLTNSDSALQTRGEEFSKRFDKKMRERLWHFPEY